MKVKKMRTTMINPARISTVLSMFLVMMISSFHQAWSATYSYDELNRLKSVTYGAGKVITYSFDAAGNITNVAVTSNDTAAPTVTGVVPVIDAVGVPVAQVVQVHFSENIDAATVTTSSLSLTGPYGPVTGTVGLGGDAKTATFTPSAPLSYSSSYSVTVGTGVKDPAGNALAAPVNWSFTTEPQPDRTPPVGTVTVNGGASYTNAAKVTAAAKATDVSGVAQMCLSTTGTCTAWTDYAESGRDLVLPAGDGAKTVNAWFRDSLGNTSGTPHSASIILDTTAPQLKLSTLSDGSVTNNDVLNVAGTISDREGVAALTVNGVQVQPATDGSFSHAVSLKSGVNAVTVTATDVAGNVTSETRNITLDLTAPTLTLDTPADNSKTAQSLVTISGSVGESARVVFSVNGGTPQSAMLNGTSLAATALLVSGVNTIEVTATDLAGNSTTAKRTVTYVDVKPTLAVTSPNQDISTNEPNLTITGTVADLLSATTVTVAFDGKTYTLPVSNGTFNQAVTMTQQRTYQIVVTATDEVGNQSAVSRNVIFDLAAPAVSVDSAAVVTNQNAMTVTGTMENGARVTASSTASIGPVSYPTSGSYSVTVSNLVEGDNEVTLNATDAAGNLATTKVSITRDTVKPVTTPSVQGGTYKSAQSVVLTASERATIYYTTDGSNPTVASAKYAAPIMISSGTTLKFFAVDPASNAEEVRNESYVIDGISPSVSSFTVPSPSRAFVVSGITFTASDNIAVAGYCLTESTTAAGCTWSVNPVTSFTFTSEGSKTLYAFARDGVGNVSNAASASVVVALPVNGACGASNGGTFSAAPSANLCSAGLASSATAGAAWNWTCQGINGGNSVACSASIADTTAPSLAVTALADGTVTANANVSISGRVTDAGGVKEISVNGTVVALQPDGSFATTVALKAGANVITTVAVDLSGNSTSDRRTVTLGKPGDCNGDGQVDIIEVQAAINMYLGRRAAAACVDVDGNLSVSITEVQKAVNSFLGL